MEKDVTSELGVKGAHFDLGFTYAEGTKGWTTKALDLLQHFEVAAMCGHDSARYHLGSGECYVGK